MSELFFTTGEAARELGVTPARIRALCESGLIAAEQTAGHQWRISQTEVQRLKQDGLPSLPRPMPGDNPRRSSKTGYGHSVLLAKPSGQVITAAEEVAITENLLKKRKLEQQLVEVEDFFRDREREEAERRAEEQDAERERQAEEEEVERLRLAAEESRRRRDRWLRESEREALHSLPYDAPPEVRLKVSDAVRDRFARLDPLPARSVTRHLVEGIVAEVVAGWRREQELEKVLLEARNGMLPYEAKSWFGPPTVWQTRAVRAAAAAIGQLRDDAPVEEIRAVARQAVAKVAAEFEEQKAAEEDAAMRQEVIRWACMPWFMTDEEQKLAPQAVVEAMAKLPPGTPRCELEEARDQALAPFHAAVAKRQKELVQRQAEERRKQEDYGFRQALLNTTSWTLPWDLSAEEREKALAAVSKALADLPEGTAGPMLEQSRDKALQPFLDAHARRKRKAELITGGLRAIHPYLLKLEDDWDFEGKTAVTLELEIREPVRERLEAELTGDETPETVEKRTKRLVREQLEIAPARTGAQSNALTPAKTLGKSLRI